MNQLDIRQFLSDLAVFYAVRFSSAGGHRELGLDIFTPASAARSVIMTVRPFMALERMER